MHISKKQNAAAGEIVELIAASLGRNREVHSATAIASAARLSGAFLLYSFDLPLEDIKPGTAVLSEHANEAGPELIGVIRSVLLDLGANVNETQMETARIHQPELDFLSSIAALQVQAHAIMKKHGLHPKDMAIACAVSTGFVVEQCKHDLPIEEGLNTAIYGLIEGAKTVPPRMETVDESSKKWYQFWSSK